MTAWRSLKLTRNLLLGILMVLAIGACGGAGQRDLSGSGAQQVRSPLTSGAMSKLPLPSALPRSASGGSGDRSLEGSEFDASLPKANVVAAAPTLAMVASGGSISQAAYAVYHFDLPGFSGAGNALTTWTTPPSSGNLYVGVADYARDTWAWYPASAGSSLQFPASIDCTSPSEQVYIAVLVTGANACTLNTVEFGVDNPPVASVRADSTFTNQFSFVGFDASASTDDIGISKFEWDWDNDGFFDEDTGTQAHPVHFMEVIGEITINMRVTDTTGHQATASTTLTVSDGTGYDEVEPNDSTETADTLPAPGFQGWKGSLGVGGFDGSLLDIHKFVVSQPQRAVFALNPDGVVDCKMTLYDTDGSTILREGGDNTSQTTLSHIFKTNGTYFLVCESFSGTGDYTLDCQSTFDIAYDETEPNNARIQADALGAGGVESYFANLGLGGYDGGRDDWFSFSAVANEMFRVDLFFYNEDANIDLELTDGAGVVLLSSALVGNGETLLFPGVDAGTYYLHCFINASEPADKASDYVLQLQDLGPRPTAVLNSDYPTNWPDNVAFDASASVIPEGESVQDVWWDLNADGYWEQQTGGVMTNSAVYRAGGPYQAKVRVILYSGAYDEAVFSIGAAGDGETEPNNDAATAGDFGVNPSGGSTGTLGPNGDDGGYVDIYKFTVGNPYKVIIDPLYDPFFMPLDLQLATWDGSQFNVLYSSSQHDGSEYIETAALSVGTTYYMIISTPPQPFYSGGYYFHIYCTF